jgi:hypothetical protein
MDIILTIIASVIMLVGFLVVCRTSAEEEDEDEYEEEEETPDAKDHPDKVVKS